MELTNGARARVLMPTASHIFTGMAPAVRQMLSTDGGPAAISRARACSSRSGWRARRHKAATEDDLAALKRALDANRKAIGDRERFTATDIAFHFELAKIARNPIFIALHDQISDWLKEQRVVTLAASGQERTAYDAHKAIYEGIAARDADGAEAGDARPSRAAGQHVLAAARRDLTRRVLII